MGVLDCDAACSLLRALETELRARGVSELSLVGSVARGEATGESDIDVVIHTKAPVSISAITRIATFLKERTGRRVDVVHSESVYPAYPMDALPERVRQNFLKDMVKVF